MHALTVALQDSDYGVRGSAAQALAQIGEKAASAAPGADGDVAEDPESSTR